LSQHMATSLLAPRGGRESAFRAGRQPSRWPRERHTTVLHPLAPRQIVIMSKTILTLLAALALVAPAVAAATTCPTVTDADQDAFYACLAAAEQLEKFTPEEEAKFNADHEEQGECML